MIVVDTNLLVYLYVRGARTSQAEAVLARDALWTAPLLWRSEFRNALVGLVRTRTLPVEDAIEIVDDAERAMAGREYTIASHRVLQLAARSGCSVYDCEYVTLAQDLTVSLVTANRRVLTAFPETAVAPEAFTR